MGCFKNSLCHTLIEIPWEGNAGFLVANFLAGGRTELVQTFHNNINLAFKGFRKREQIISKEKMR